MTRGLGLVLFVGLLCGWSPNALAQAVHLDQYRAAPTPEDSFALSRATDLGHLRFGARLDVDYAFNPLVYEAVAGDASSERASVVEHHLAAQMGLSLGIFDRAVLYVGLPVNLLMNGEVVSGQPLADGTSLGDLRLGARVRLWGERLDPFALALQFTLTLPTARGVDRMAVFAGEDGASLHPQLIGELRPGAGVRVGLNLGARVRATDRARFRSSELDIGHELTWAVGVSVPLLGPRLELGAELYGATTLERPGERATSPLELIVSVRTEPADHLVLGLAGGLGLTRGYGSPDFRGVFTVGWVDDRTAAHPAVRSSQTTNRGEAPSAGDDSDQALRASVRGVETVAPSRASGESEPYVVAEAEVAAGAVEQAEFTVSPEASPGSNDVVDSDGDGVPDLHDACPSAPGSAEEYGCPRFVRFDDRTGRVRVLRAIEFGTSRAILSSESVAILEEIYALLEVHPGLRQIRVEGHTDNRGGDPANLALSVERAGSVITWLVERGVSRSRLVGIGCGAAYPIDTHTTTEGRARNRRVEFRVIDPEPDDGEVERGACRAVESSE